MTDAANEARRNVSAEREREIAREQAKTKERTKSKVGKRERRFANWLRQVGYNPTLQKAVDIYNVDIAVGSVAIEIHIQASHPHGHPYYTRRIEDLLQRGFNVLYVKMTTDEHPLTSRACDEAVAFIELTESSESTPRKYRVIRGTGDPIAVGRLDSDELSTESTSKYLLDVG
jgi:sugar diacid utilization regulator